MLPSSLRGMMSNELAIKKRAKQTRDEEKKRKQEKEREREGEEGRGKENRPYFRGEKNQARSA